MQTFKKYPNRRIYSLAESKYMRMEEIGAVLMTGEAIQVIDTSSQKDVTVHVMCAVIAALVEAGRATVRAADLQALLVGKA